MGKERRGRRKEGKEDEGGEKKGLPPLEWRSGYAPKTRQNSHTHTHTLHFQLQGGPKTLAPFFLYALTLPNINRFSKLFHD